MPWLLPSRHRLRDGSEDEASINAITACSWRGNRGELGREFNNTQPPLAGRFYHARHGVLASLRSSIPSFGLPPPEEQPGSSLGGLGRGWACLHGPARGVRLDNRAKQPGQGATGRTVA